MLLVARPTPYLKTGAQEIVSSFASFPNHRSRSVGKIGATMSSLSSKSFSNENDTANSNALRLNFQNVFSPQNKDQTIINVHNKKIGFKFREGAFTRKAAVLIPLCFDKKGQPAILYTLRSLNMNKHSGEISFPGGAADPEDLDDPITTALRETEEELGISRDSVEIWTTLSPMPTLISLMGVTPVLGFLKLGNIDAEELKISPNEVEKAFTITLEHLCTPGNWREKMKMGIAWPAFKNMNVRHPKSAETDEPPEVNLWGLTAIITHIVLESLVPNQYTRRLPFFEAKPLDPSQSPSFTPDPERDYADNTR